MKKYTGNIEYMPVGAKFTGIVTEPDRLVMRIGILECPGKLEEIYKSATVDRSITFSPARIEISEDVVTLLRGPSFGSGRYAANAEIGIKRGTLVEWEI